MPSSQHASAPAVTAAPPRPDSPIDAAIDRALAERRLVGAVVLVARDGDVVYRRAAGYADREARRPMVEDALFRLASVTKPIVSAAALALVERGVLGLDDPVTRWLPDFRPRLSDGTAPTITVRHLLTHTAGLTYSFFQPADGPYARGGVSDGLDDVPWSLDENLRRLAAAPLAFAPGTAWGYSVAHDVLGAVLAAAAGRPLPAVVATLVTGPLGMRATSFGPHPLDALVTPYADPAAEPGASEPVRMGPTQVVPVGLGGGTRFSPTRAAAPHAFPSGGAGLTGTASDVLAFLEALRTDGGGALSAESARALRANAVGALRAAPGWGWSLGAAVLVDPGEAATPQAPGTVWWNGAYGHSWFVDPANDLTVVALTNTAFEGMWGRFTTDLRDAVYAALVR